MTIETLIATLRANGSISAWKIAETRRSGTEWYLVGKDLDMARSVEVLEYRLTIYADREEAGTRRRGEATVSVHPTMGASEIEALVARAAAAAARSRNPWFPLPEPATWKPLAASRFEGRGSAAWMPELRDALYSASLEGARVNSLEIFLTRQEHRIINSRGVDATYSRWRGDVEHTVEAGEAVGGVELTDAFSFSEPDFERLAEEIHKALGLARDRVAASPLPSAEGLPLILSGNCAEELLRWFFANLDGARIYSGGSPIALGESLHGPDADRDEYDPLTMAAEPAIAGAAGSSPLDPDGTPLVRTVLARDGMAVELHGQSRYAHYLGRRPVGGFALFSVGPGSAPAAQLRAVPHLEAMAFSDFGVDLDTGDFGGEVRLAYLSDGKGDRPVTGGSITGSLLENRDRLRLSRETALSGSMLGPVAILLPFATIAGAE